MQEGFDPLEAFCHQLELNFFQKSKIKTIILFVLFYKVFILPFQKKKKIQLQKTLESYQNMPLNVQRTHLKASEGNYYLSEEEIQNVEKDGLIKPFKVISAEEVIALKEEITDQVDKDFEGKHYLGDEITATLKKHNSFNLSSGGLYQALRLKNFRDLLRKPQIAQRLASLRGEELLYWRSHFFEKKPKSTGTFWH
ncbi:MAG: non-heme Fe2+,alpha-ketoglutarate-dependent halogenase [Aureispira sp.]|jgi:non-heme Fe2+,alpha-ketoglutarate-dependent halogenase